MERGIRAFEHLHDQAVLWSAASNQLAHCNTHTKAVSKEQRSAILLNPAELHI